MTHKKFFMMTLLLFLLVAAIPVAASAEASSEKYFTIPMNSPCSQSQIMDLSINVSNLNNEVASFTLHLYKKDGNEITTQGTAYDGVESTIVPGITATLAGKNTAMYHLSFGGPLSNCSERVYYGKIVSQSSNAVLLAGGWVDGARGNSTIIINGGEPWSTTTNPTPICIGKNGDLIPTMESNSSVCGTATASSSFNLIQPFFAFDDKNTSEGSSAWISKGVNTGWLSYEFANPKVVTKYTLVGQNHGGPSTDAELAGRPPKNWTFEGTNDGGKTWAVLDTQTNIINWEFGVKKEFTISNTTPYKQYRINVTANQGGSYLAIGEMEMMGY